MEMINHRFNQPQLKSEISLGWQNMLGNRRLAKTLISGGETGT
jgi:hypothetical protein